ncbi:MAG: type IV pilus biogenesis protein PilM [Candidatus Acidiferrales bacterium]
MTSNNTPTLARKIHQFGPMRRLSLWLNSIPHPTSAVEISPTYVAAARSSKGSQRLESFAMEGLAEGNIVPSPIEPNIKNADAVRVALRTAFHRTLPRSGAIALLIPDPAVRVFILPFDTLSREPKEALPLLRWRLKKSVPFDMDETVVSWMRQGGKEGNLEVVTSVARRGIIREYEEIAESLGVHPGVVVSSTLATLPLIEDRGSTLLVRMSGRTLTTAIISGSALCIYRSTEMTADAAQLEPQFMLDEIFPALAYYQDTWGGSMDRVLLSGLGGRENVFREALSRELHCPISPFSTTSGLLIENAAAAELVRQGLDGLAGWMLNGGV